MKRITILTGPMAGHGGEETVIKEFIELLSDTFKFNLVISEQSQNNLWVNNIHKGLADSSMNTKKNKINKLIFIMRCLKNVNDSLVICLTPRMVFWASFAKKLFRKKYKIVSWMHFSISIKFNLKTASQLKKADYHLAISSGIKRELLELKIPENRIGLIYNPVQRQNKSIFPGQKETKFIYIARIQYEGQKNISELLTALGMLEKADNWSLYIYGSDDSKDYEETKKCVALISRLGIEDHVKWVGWKRDVWKEVASANSVIMTSKYEGFPMVLGEAISYGIPVISSLCPTGPEDIVTKQNGFLYPMGDVRTLSMYLSGFIKKKYHFENGIVKKSIENIYSDSYGLRVQKVINGWIEENER